jgi:hypothetical protein
MITFKGGSVMPLELESRPYGEDSTPQEIEAIRARVYPYKDNLIMYNEVPVPSRFQLQHFEERMNEIAKTVDYYDLLIDLTVAQPPGAEIREQLKKLFGGQKKLRKTAVFTGRNFMLNVAARFVLGRAGLREFSVHKTLDEALEAIGHGR